MAYDPTKLKDKILPKAGTQVKAYIVEIEDGTLAEFVPKDQLSAWKNTESTDPFINVSAETTDGETRKKLLQLSKTSEVHPKSNLGRWKKTFGDYPFNGQEIYLVADNEGFYQFNLLD